MPYRGSMAQTYTWRVDVWDNETRELVMTRMAWRKATAREAADWIAEYLDLEAFGFEARIEVNLHDE